MIVLHALWSADSRWLVWGEREQPPARKRKRRGPGLPDAIPAHPFACESDELGESIEIAVGELLPDGATACTLRLLLPSSGSAPLPSPDLAPSGAARGRDRPELAPWSVSAWGFEAGDALDLLLRLDRIGIPDEPDVAIGDSVRYWLEVARRAVEQVALGRFVPGIVQVGGEYRAIWRPPDDLRAAEWFAPLARGMPASCRTELDSGGAVGLRPDWRQRFTGQRPVSNLESGFGAFLDAAVRGVARVADTAGANGRSRRSRRSHSPAEAWVAALTSPDPRVPGDASALAALAARIDRWIRSPDDELETTGFRTCFRVRPPVREDDADPEPAPVSASMPPPSRKKRKAAPVPEDVWRIDFLLQARDDPSLLIEPEAIWSAPGARLAALGRVVPQPQEKLLAGLGRARHLVAEMETALRSSHPSGVDLDTPRAYRFLAEQVPLLEQAGFGILAPGWWRSSSRRVGLKLVARATTNRSNGSGSFGLESLCAFEWKLSLGDEEIDADDFRALAGLKTPLVRYRGEWVELGHRDVESALRLLEDGGAAGQMTAGEALRIAIGAAPGPADLPVVGVEASGWIAALLDPTADERSLAPVEEPAAFAATLRPYQLRGLAWLAFLDSLGLGACLADDMGLGKTPQTLALLALEQERRAAGDTPALPTLLVCPMSLVGNWQREAARFTPDLRVHVHHGAERSSGDEFRAAVAGSDLVITTYALAARDRDDLAALHWARVVLDEAQNIKNPDTRQAQSIRSIPADRRIALTGTPVENRLSELWSILDFLNPGLLGSQAAFRREFAIPIERYRDDTAAARLRRLTTPFILRRLKTDRSIIQDLPEKIEMSVLCNLTREQASLYQAAVDEMLERAERSDGIERKGIVLAGMTRLKQICNHPTHFLRDRTELDERRSGKLARVNDLVEEILARDERVLVFTQYAELGQLLADHLAAKFRREVLFLHGGTSRQARERMVESFQAEGGAPIFILSLKAGGTGLNLTAANHVIHFDRWWNPAVEDQATDRAFRIGQLRDVQVRKLLCIGTLEERIDRMIREKKALAETIVGSGEGWLTELSTDQLRDLVRLSADAVAE